MATISLCMIVKNEEKVLRRCLESAKVFADEIIVVDTGSTDHTMEIAAQFTDRIYEFPWNDDFSAARNFSFSKAVMDYCMWLDADDVIQKEEQKKILQLKNKIEPDVSVVMMKYVTAFDDSGKPAFLYDRERLLKNKAGFVWQGRVHEVIAPFGRVLYTDIQIEHRSVKKEYTDRNLKIYEKMAAEGETLEPRHQFYYGRELFYHGRYEEAIAVLDDFLDGKNGAGWVENQIEACSCRADCCYGLGRDEEALKSLLHSFLYDLPRAELCCKIGLHFLDRNRPGQAAYWYRRALSSKENHPGAFTDAQCYGFVPAIQLAVCLDRMGKTAEASYYNELAADFNPDSAAVKYNREYFQAALSGGKGQSQKEG